MNKRYILIILTVFFVLSGCKEKDTTDYPLRGNPTDYRKLDEKSLLALSEHVQPDRVEGRYEQPREGPTEGRYHIVDDT